MKHKYSVERIGELVRLTRKKFGITQQELALTSGTGQRFISDLENGKPTCQLGKTLIILQTLGIEVVLNAPLDLSRNSKGLNDSEMDEL